MMGSGCQSAVTRDSSIRLQEAEAEMMVKIISKEIVLYRILI